MHKYRASGTDKQDAYDRYRKVIQDSTNWRSVADEFFDEAESYRPVKSDRSIHLPMAHWNTLVDVVLPAAYKSSNTQLIHRLYAYSEWCLAQVQPEGTDPGKHLPTCVAICFYEALPSSPPALRDLPSWFSWAEAENTFLSNPYMGFHVKALREVFAAT